MLEIINLNAFYGPAQALFDVSLSVARGEWVVLQGLNGAGKSTLLKSLIGLEVRTEGELRYDSGNGLVEIQSWPAHRRARAGLGYVAEDRRLFTGLSVRENLRVVAGRQDATVEARVLDLFPALKKMLHRPAGQMSGGEQQMLAIARTLMTEPKLLMLDEPCEGLAPVLVEAIRDALLALRADGMTLLMAEQNQLLAGSADRLALLVAGKVGASPEAA
jgi:branched-chain amino acid transport system ATP-binding protein